MNRGREEDMAENGQIVWRHKTENKETLQISRESDLDRKHQ